jgi:hypothetical protein
MRKVAGILIVSAMLLPVGAIAAAPAGSATTGLTCTKVTGTATWSPGVPLASKPKAASTVTLKAALAGCTGTAGITSGVISLPTIPKAAPQNCLSLLKTPPKLTRTGGVITWNNKLKTKSTLGTLTLTPSGPLSYKATAKVTKGQFITKTLVVIGTFTPVKPGCSTAPMTKATLVIKKGTKALIK